MTRALQRSLWLAAAYLAVVAALQLIQPSWVLSEYLPVFGLGLAAALWFIYRDHLTPATLGLTDIDPLGWWWYALFTVAVLLGLYLVKSSGALGSAAALDWGMTARYGLLSAPFQEFLFRSLPIALFNKYGLRPYATVLLSALLFGAIHLIVGGLSTVLMAFLIGLAWGALFFRYRNWYAVTLSHIAIGLFALWIGVI